MTLQTDASITGDVVVDTVTIDNSDQAPVITSVKGPINETVNGDFETGSGSLPDGWEARADAGDVVPTWDAVDPYSGLKCIKFAPNGANVAGQIFLTQKFPVGQYNAVNLACFAKCVSTGGGAATCNFGVQVKWYTEAGKLFHTVGTEYERNSTSHGTYTTSNSKAFFHVEEGAVEMQYAFAVSDMSSNCEVYIDAFSGHRSINVQISGFHGEFFNQVRDYETSPTGRNDDGTKFAMLVASGIVGDAVRNTIVAMGVRNTSGDYGMCRGYSPSSATITPPASGDILGVTAFNFGHNGTNFVPLSIDASTGNLKTLSSNFPAAAALADNTANPTTTLIGSCQHAWDGSTWDRIRTGQGDGGTTGYLNIVGMLYNGTNYDRVRGDLTGGTWQQGAIAHDGVDSGNPIKIGMRALAHGTNPTAVAAADRTDWLANRAGIPWVIGGHPNPICHSVRVLGADGAQTDVAIVTVSSGTKICVTHVSVTADGSNTGPVNITLGFGTSTLTTPNTTTAGTGILADFLGVPPGGGMSKGNGGGLLGVGADGADLRYTCEAPAGGAITINVTYYTIES